MAEDGALRLAWEVVATRLLHGGDFCQRLPTPRRRSDSQEGWLWSNDFVMNDPSLLSDVNRYVGVALAVFGSVVVAPRGTVLLWRSATDWPLQRKQQLRGQLARFLPFLRRDVTIHAANATGGASAFGATATGSARAWHPDAPVDKRIDALRQHITEVEGRLNEVTGKLREETASREGVVAELKRTMEEKTAELRRLGEEKERESAQIDARGLPFVGSGILLNGIPNELASVPFGLGWMFPILGVGLGVGVVAVAIVHRWRARTPS